MSSIDTVEVEQVEVVVVGAGSNGLISAKTYLDFRPSADLLILDQRASIGGVWSTEQIYPDLFAQMKHGLFEYSFYPMRHEGMSDDNYISGSAIHTYLNDFAWDFDLVRRTRLETTVTNVSQIPGRGWRLEIAGKPVIECEKLIYASGATSHPVKPVWTKQTGFNAPIIHSTDVGPHMDALKGVKSATVVGGAKSSYDLVFLLLKAGKKVDWIIRDDGTGPLAIMPPTLLGLVNSMDVVSSRFMAMMGMSIMSTDGAGHQFFQRNILGRFIVWVFWLIVNWIATRHAGYSKSENANRLKPLPHGNGIFWANAGLGLASVPLFWRTFHDGDCTVHRTDIKGLLDGNIVHLTDGARFQTDYIVSCTGFDKSYQVFSDELQKQCGLVPDEDPAEERKWRELDREAEDTVDELLPYLKNSRFSSRNEFRLDMTAGGRKLLHGPSRHYRRLIVPKLAAMRDRSIIFPGFIHTILTPTVSEVQALWGVAFLLGLHNPPSQSEMELEVAEWNAWSRKRYVSQGKKHAYAIYDFLPYIDVMLTDLGVNPKRKRNWLANLFMPAYPREYRGVLDEFRQTLDPKFRLKTDNTKPAAMPSQSSDRPRVNGHSTGISLNGQFSGLSKANGHTNGNINGYSTGGALKGHNKSGNSFPPKFSA